MKMLLTSNGLSNKSIADALFDLVGKTPSETRIVFIPTAANAARGDMGWFAKDIYNIYKQGLKYFDVADISAMPKDTWLPKLEAADVLFFSGGNTPHLIRWLNESGLKDLLPELLKTRVYAGISAGSIVTAKTLESSGAEKKEWYKEKFGYENNEGLGLVDFYVRPHYKKQSKEGWPKEALEELAKQVQKTLYVLDDNSALKVVGDKVEVITEGEYLKLN
jgi:dipeptidase E